MAKVVYSIVLIAVLAGCDGPAERSPEDLVIELMAVDDNQGGYAGSRRSLSSRFALLGTNAALRAARFEPVGKLEKQKAPRRGANFAFLARPTGFEPVTPAFGGQYSIQLSYGRLGGAVFYRLSRNSGKIEFTMLPLQIPLDIGHDRLELVCAPNGVEMMRQQPVKSPAYTPAIINQSTQF